MLNLGFNDHCIMASQLIIKNKIEIERAIKVAVFKKKIRKTEPHKHNNYFEIIYLSKGSGTHFIDLGKYAIVPPVMFFVRKEQVHYWHLDTEAEGFVIIIKKAFIENSLDMELKYLLGKISNQACLRISDNKTIESLFRIMIEESDAGGKHGFQITEGLLKSLLAKVMQAAESLTLKAEANADLYHSFIDLLSSDHGIKNKVAFYAEKLHTSPQNLNAVCRKAVGQSASDVLSRFVISEAKRLLLYTDNTVSGIAFMLEFTDPSHFVKFFKKATGVTPRSFRLLTD